MITYDMLICSIPHRDATLRELLAELDRQLHATMWNYIPGIGARIFRDNLETGYGEKCQALLESSAADYVSFVDDDDMVAPDFVPRVMKALADEPDYVGFPVRWTVDGAPSLKVEHSLRHPGWQNHGDRLIRDLVHFNPIRRDLALLGTWSGGYGADFRWAEQVRATGRVRTETWIGEEMYYYRNRPADTFQTHRQPAEKIMPLPEYPWLTAIS
jgi:hypothetical protein